MSDDPYMAPAADTDGRSFRPLLAVLIGFVAGVLTAVFVMVPVGIVMGLPSTPSLFFVVFVWLIGIAVGILAGLFVMGRVNGVNRRRRAESADTKPERSHE